MGVVRRMGIGQAGHISGSDVTSHTQGRRRNKTDFNPALANVDKLFSCEAHVQHHKSWDTFNVNESVVLNWSSGQNGDKRRLIFGSSVQDVIADVNHLSLHGVQCWNFPTTKNRRAVL